MCEGYIEQEKQSIPTNLLKDYWKDGKSRGILLVRKSGKHWFIEWLFI